MCFHLKIAKYFIVTDTLKVINDNKVEHIKAVIENLREKFASYPYKPILKKLFINNIQIPRKEVNAVEMVMFSNGILNKLTEITGMTVVPDYTIDSKIKGGLKVQIDTWVYDASISNKLNALYTKLTTGN